MVSLPWFPILFLCIILLLTPTPEYRYKSTPLWIWAFSYHFSRFELEIFGVVSLIALILHVVWQSEGLFYRRLGTLSFLVFMLLVLLELSDAFTQQNLALLSGVILLCNRLKGNRPRFRCIFTVVWLTHVMYATTPDQVFYGPTILVLAFIMDNIRRSSIKEELSSELLRQSIRVIIREHEPNIR